ncbi:MAG: sulfatase-like hydrolase/transferase [Phycisphaerae bacterium]|nr:sulfatase-like hydrolase/transferase [Phycisphaerae bacterium]
MRKPDSTPGRFARLWTEFRNLLYSQRVRPLWVLGLVCYGLFGGFRLGLCLANMGSFDGASFPEIMRCFALGICYDTMVIGYILIPPAVLLTISPPEAFARPWFNRIVRGYAAVTSLLVLAIEVIGVSYYLHGGTRTNRAFAYYLRYPQEVFGHVWREYPLWFWLLTVPVIIFLLYKLYHHSFGKGIVHELPHWRRPAFSGVILFLCIVAARGGLQSRPLSSTLAYENTSNQLLVELTKNNCYELFQGARTLINEVQKEDHVLNLPKLKIAKPIVKKLYFQDADTSLGLESNPLWRRTETHIERKQMNVVFIVMESMAGKHIGALGYPHPSQTPNLDALCREGLFFSKMFAIGARTNKGMIGTLSGYPGLCQGPVIASKLAEGNFLTLPGIFQRRGYKTVFIYGGRPTFDNMDRFLTTGGVDQIIGQNQMPTKNPYTWGAPDEYVFQKAIETFDKMGDRRFFGLILTVSNHPPFKVPSGRVRMLPANSDENKIINATSYADWALGKFFRNAHSTKWFKNTIFVLVSDSGRAVALDKKLWIDAVGFRIPCLIYAPGLIPPEEIDVVASQTDIAPTLLSLMGGEFEHCFFGRNLLTVSRDNGFALLHENNRRAFVRGDYLLVQPPGGKNKPLLYRITQVATELVSDGELKTKQIEKLSKEMGAIYKMAKYVYDKGLYSPRPPKENGGN